MNIKPQTGKRNYAKGGAVKGYVEGGQISADESSPWGSTLPVSGGTAGEAGGYVLGGAMAGGGFEEENPSRGSLGSSEWYVPAGSKPRKRRPE